MHHAADQTGPVWVPSQGKQAFLSEKKKKIDWGLKQVCQVPQLLPLMRSVTNHTVRINDLETWPLRTNGHIISWWDLSPREGSHLLSKCWRVAFSAELGLREEAWKEGYEDSSEE